MTPAELAKSDSEHAHQKALFAWALMASNYGINAANDDASYSSRDYVLSTYGTEHAIKPLSYMYATPNGGSRGDNAKSRAIRGAMLKAEGVKAGVPDIFLPYPVHTNNLCFETFGETEPVGWLSYVCGLYIEMKKPSEKPKRSGKGGVSEEQTEYMTYLKSVGYCCKVCYHYLEAIDVITKYLKGV